MADTLDFRSAHLIGMLIAKIDYWRKRYYFSFNFDDEDNIVFISKDDVELTSFDARSIRELFEDTISWCEKSYPRYKYPDGIEIINEQP